MTDFVFFQGVGWVGNRTSSYKGLLSCDRIFYIPTQYKPKLPSRTQLREEGLYGCMTLLTSLRDARDYSSISHLLYACIKHMRQMPLSFSTYFIKKSFIYIKKAFFFHFYEKLADESALTALEKCIQHETWLKSKYLSSSFNLETD